MFGIGMPELILILIVGLVVFGPSKLPEIGRSLGKAMREFRKASNAFTAAMNAPETTKTVVTDKAKEKARQAMWGVDTPPPDPSLKREETMAAESAAAGAASAPDTAASGAPVAAAAMPGTPQQAVAEKEMASADDVPAEQQSGYQPPTQESVLAQLVAEGKLEPDAGKPSAGEKTAENMPAPDKN